MKLATDEETKKKGTILVCPDGQMHSWSYSAPEYKCLRCDTRATKSEMKELTD